MNDFYNPTPNVPPEDTRSDPEKYTAAEFALVGAGFDKMPRISAGRRNRLVEINSAETALTLGKAVQEKAEPEDLTVFPDIWTDAVNLHDFRLETTGYYRVSCLFPYSVLSGTTGLKARFVYTWPPRYAAGIVVSETLALWQAATDSFQSTEEMLELHGVVRMGSRGFARVQFRPTASSSHESFPSVSVHAGAAVRFVRLDS